MAKNINTYVDLSIEELHKALQEKKEILFNMRFQKSLQQLDHPMAIRNAKKELAELRRSFNDDDSEDHEPRQKKSRWKQTESESEDADYNAGDQGKP